MTARAAGLTLAAFALFGCGCPRPVAVAQVATHEPEPVPCEIYRLPGELRFACNEATFDPELGDNRWYFPDLVERLRTTPSLRRVIVRGTVSANGTPERDHPELAAQRAHSVADALVRAGLPRSRVEVDDHVGWDTAAYNENDPCPPRAEDEHGDRRRAVFINFVRCGP